MSIRVTVVAYPSGSNEHLEPKRGRWRARVAASPALRDHNRRASPSPPAHKARNGSVLRPAEQAADETECPGRSRDRASLDLSRATVVAGLRALPNSTERT